MKKFRSQGRNIITLIVMMCFMFAAVPADAAVRVATMGRKDSMDTHVVEVDSDGVVTFRSDAGVKTPYQSATTNDTLTAADSGRTYVVTHSSAAGNGAVRLNLPAATVGLVFPIVSATTNYIEVDPNGTDVIQYASLTAGQSISNEGSSAKGDKIEFVCVVAGEWAVAPEVGTWAAGRF